MDDTTQDPSAGAAAPAPTPETTTTTSSAPAVDTSAEHAELAALAGALPPATGEVNTAAAPAPAVSNEPPPVSRLHTYDDGSQVVGVPPFPELSPLQLQAKKIRDETPAQDTFAQQQAEIELAQKTAAARANMVTGTQIETSKPTA